MYANHGMSYDIKSYRHRIDDVTHNSQDFKERCPNLTELKNRASNLYSNGI